MTIALLEALAADLLEYKHLVCPCLVVNDCCLDNCAFYIGSSDLYVSLVVNEKNLVELNVSTFGLRKSLDKDFISSFYLELLACNVYDCVHKKTLLKFGPQASATGTALCQWLDGHLIIGPRN